MKLRLCRVLNSCNSWAKGSPFPTRKSNNKSNKSKTFCIIAGRLINKITLLALKCFCTRWDVQLTMADISTKWTAVSGFRPTSSHLAKRNYMPDCLKFRQRRQRLTKFKKFKLALPITFNGKKCRSTPINLEDTFSHSSQRLGNKWQIFLPHENTRATWRMGGQSAVMATIEPQYFKF